MIQCVSGVSCTSEEPYPSARVTNARTATMRGDEGGGTGSSLRPRKSDILIKLLKRENIFREKRKAESKTVKALTHANGVRKATLIFE